MMLADRRDEIEKIGGGEGRLDCCNMLGGATGRRSRGEGGREEIVPNPLPPHSPHLYVDTLSLAFEKALRVIATEMERR